MARKRRNRRRYPHIYFESKKPRTRDSVTLAVRDIGKEGVNNAKEVCALAIAQFLDWPDGYTYDHSGKRKKFTGKLWASRTLILKRLARKYGGMGCVNFVVRLRRMVVAKKLTKTQARKIAIDYAKKKGLPLLRTKI